VTTSPKSLARRRRIREDDWLGGVAANEEGTSMNRLLPVSLFVVLLTGCDATIDSRTSSDPTQEGAGGDEARSREVPTCVSCSDALAGESGNICDDKLVDALEVCSEEHCLGACDDNLFRTLTDKTKVRACDTCLSAKCAPEFAVCAAN
jgi:hypothetical protein